MPEVAIQAVAAGKARDVSAENISMSRPVDHKKSVHRRWKWQTTGATSPIEKQTKSLRRKEKEKDLMVKERRKVGAHESESTDASKNSTLIPGESPAIKQEKVHCFHWAIPSGPGTPGNSSCRAQTKPDDSLRSASRK